MAATNNEDKKVLSATKKAAETKAKKKPAAKKVVKEVGNEFLEYKGKKLVRVENEIYYGNIDDPYVVTFRLEDNQQLKDITVSKKVIIELKTNEGKASKLVRQAERDGLYKAFDIGMFWLDQALGQIK